MANGDGDGSGSAPAGPLAWFSPGVARWLLLVIAVLAVVGTGIPLSLTGHLPGERVFSAVEKLAFLVVAGLLPLLGARVMADAKDKSSSEPAPPAPPPAPPAATGS